MQREGAHLCLKFITDFVLYYSHLATHPPACSDGATPLKLAILGNNRDVVALLRGVGARE
jgi:hypothetical protein